MRGGVQGRLPAEASDETSLASVARALWRRKTAVIAPTILIAAAAFAVANVITPVYKSEARVLIEGRENVLVRPEAGNAPAERGTVDAETVTSQVQRVLSRDLAREVVDGLNLGDLPEFNAALREFPLLSVLRSIGILKDPMSISPEERVLATYYDRLQAFAVDKTRVIAIEFQSADPELAARIANLIAEKYLAFRQVTKQDLAKPDLARSASPGLPGELDRLREKVSDAEARVEEFRARSNRPVGSDDTDVSARQLSDLNTQVTAARAQQADAEARARSIRDALQSGQTIESSGIVNSESIRRLSERRMTLRAQLTEQSSILLPQHPRIKQMRAQIDDLEQQIRSEGERLAGSLENEAKVAGTRLEALNATLEQLNGQAISTGEQDVQLRALEREARAQRELFESSLAKHREAASRDNVAAPADARIIARATVSNIPYFPKKAPIVVIAALGTFSLAAAFVAAGALVNGATASSVRVPVSPTPAPAAPVRPPTARARVTDRISAASKAKGIEPPQPAPAAAAPASPANSIADLAAELQAGGDGSRRIAMIGSAREVGTTLSTIALARMLARCARVVLVDLSFASPNIDLISNDPSAPGIADLVRGAASFGDVITRDSASRLHLVAAGQVGNDAQHLLVSEMLWAALDALAHSYDYLIIDAGPGNETALDQLAACAPLAVLVSGAGHPAALDALAGELQDRGFAEVAILTGPPPVLEDAAMQSASAA